MKHFLYCFQSIAFSYEFGAKNISKIELEKWHFNTESYGLVVKVTPMLPYNFGPPPPPGIGNRRGRGVASQSKLRGLNRLKLLKIPSKSSNFRFLLGFDTLSRSSCGGLFDPSCGGSSPHNLIRNYTPAEGSLSGTGDWGELVGELKAVYL